MRDPKADIFTADGLRFEAQEKLLFSAPKIAIGAQGTTVILGPNGAGKSVMLRLMHGLLRATGGTMHWADGAGADAQALVFQKPVLLRRSVRANLAFALKSGAGSPAERRAKIAEHLAGAGLSDRASQSARTLSGGQQQRLAVARALVRDPSVLMLDEPTASLDPSATLEIEQMIHDAKQAGAKIIMVTHDIGQAKRLADDVMFLWQGALVSHQKAPQFFAAPDAAQAKAFLSGQIAKA